MMVSVLIVTYNSAHCIPSCLRSVQRQTGVTFDIIVVDNASQDATAERIRTSHPKVHLIANETNVGFGRANNQAATAGRGDFLYLLNPDAALADDRALARMAEIMAAHPKWGLAGTRVLSEDGSSESPPESTYPDQHLASNCFDKLPGEIAWVIGASMFIRRNAFLEIGGFDPGFFLHSEETDLCLRLRQAGHEIGYIPEVEVRHIGGASDSDPDPYQNWVRRLEGLHRFWSKHYAPADVRRLARRELLRSRLRANLYRMLGVVIRRPAFTAKSRRYEAIEHITQRLIERLNSGDA